MGRQQKILSTQELQTLIQGAKENKQNTSLPNEEDVMLIKACVGHGLRNEETVTLQRKHVDLGSKVGVNIELENTKTESGVRFAPTLKVIGSIHIKSHFENYVEKNTSEPDDFLFPSNRTDGHVTERYFQNLMRDLAWILGFYPWVSAKDSITDEVDEQKRVRPHSLRHTYGTRMYENGVPAKECADILGHKDVETFLNMYTHLATERSRDMLDEAATNWD